MFVLLVFYGNPIEKRAFLIWSSESSGKWPEVEFVSFKTRNEGKTQLKLSRVFVYGQIFHASKHSHSKSTGLETHAKGIVFLYMFLLACARSSVQGTWENQI